MRFPACARSPEVFDPVLYLRATGEEIRRARVSLSLTRESLAERAGVEYIIPQDRIELPRLSDRQLTAFVAMPMTSYTESQDFAFTVTDSASGIAQDIKVRFRGP